ncbi:MAG: hypothetical protein JJU36_00795 [Phycisphaeraceae bacterium]|nr:hypothetical protein [Phycisphaeraceae bacterium]
MQVLITDHGATPDQTINTAAIQAAIDSVRSTGGRVVIPPGRWRCGTVWLRSGVELHLAMGATLLGTNDPADYPAWSPVEAGVVRSRRAGPRRMVGASQCEHIAVTGPGTIDGDGGCGGQIRESGGNEAHPQNLQFIDCRDVQVRDVTLRSAGSWMQQYLACEGVRLTGLDVWNHGNKTNDGLDIDGCREVLISDCDIDSHDDAMVFKSTGPMGCRNILVSNCRFRSNCHGIKFGTESVGGFENIRVSNCIVSPSRRASPMAGYPEGRPVITGCALECVDGGVMRHVHIDGLLVERVFAPIFIKLGNRLDRRLDEADPPEGMIEDISIRNVHARQAGPYSCSITGYPGRHVRRVQLENIDIEHVGGVRTEDILEKVPEHSDRYPEINMFTRDSDKQLPSYGFYLRHVREISLRNISLRLLEPDAREPIISDDVEDLRMENVIAGGAESWA